MATVADVFIIESLDPDDEGNGRFEGSVISHILKLHGKAPKYRYVRTRAEFEHAVRQFAKSRYRYLHISAHADANGMCTTNLEEIHYSELAAMLTPVLKDKRLFLSACSMVHKQMASAIIPTTDCVSIVGPIQDIHFSEAAVFWPAVYHLIFSTEKDAMSHMTLKKHLINASTLFDIKIGYYSRSKIRKRGYTGDILKAK